MRGIYRLWVRQWNLFCLSENSLNLRPMTEKSLYCPPKLDPDINFNFGFNFVPESLLEIIVEVAYII